MLERFLRRSVLTVKVSSMYIVLRPGPFLKSTYSIEHILPNENNNAHSACDKACSFLIQTQHTV